MLQPPKEAFSCRLRWVVLFLLWTVPNVAWAQDPAKVIMGKQAFRSYCATCHGASGQGDGSLAAVLTVKPSDLTVLARENNGEFPAERTRKVIDGREQVKGHGSGEMPVWGDAFNTISGNEDEVAIKIDRLVNFLESIQVE